MSGGLFGGYQKLLDKVYTGNPEIDAKLDNAAKNYSDTNNYRTHKVLNEISLTQTSGAEADPVSAAANAEPSLQGDVPSPKTNIPQNGNPVNTLDAENSAAKAQQRKPGTVSAEQKTLLQTDVLLSAFADENGIVPVRLTVKEYKDKDNSLYALITLEKIETEIKDRGESFATTPTPYPVSEMSIPDIVSKIKPTDGNILKYLPDKLLSAEQLEGKRAKR